MKAISGEPVVVPIDITWNKDAKVRPSRDWAAEIIKTAKNLAPGQRRQEAQEILYYGAFSGNEDWVHELKAAIRLQHAAAGQLRPSQARQLASNMPTTSSRSKLCFENDARTKANFSAS